MVLPHRAANGVQEEAEGMDELMEGREPNV